MHASCAALLTMKVTRCFALLYIAAFTVSIFIVTTLVHIMDINDTKWHIAVMNSRNQSEKNGNVMGE